MIYKKKVEHTTTINISLIHSNEQKVGAHNDEPKK